MWEKIITPSAATIDERQMSKEEFLPSQTEPDVHLELRCCYREIFQQSVKSSYALQVGIAIRLKNKERRVSL